jgi:uncharacterized membrane protein
VEAALSAESEFCVVVRGNDSLGRQGRWRIFAALALVSIVVASVVAAAGAWPVLPYSVLELILLAAAFLCIERRVADWERLVIAGDRVIVEWSAEGKRRRREFNRLWLRVECAEQRTASASGRRPVLSLHYAGEALEFGAALPAAERVALARDLRRRMG